MSYTEIMVFERNGKAKSYKQIKNASRGSAVIWSHFSNKYLGEEYPWFDIEKQWKTWNLFRDNRLTENEKIVLGSTFDFVLVKKVDFPSVIEAFRELYVELKSGKNINVENSLLEQAEVLEELLNNEDCVAIGWHQNSVSCDMWDEYDLNSGEEHWYLFN